VIAVASILTQRRLVLVAASALLFWFTPVISATTATSIILEVGATGGLPGVQNRDLPQFLALRMTDAGLTEWRFAPATGGGLPANYVLWAFKANPYAGGEVRSFAPIMRSCTAGVRSRSKPASILTGNIRRS
jgi:hypothetical protein